MTSQERTRTTIQMWVLQRKALWSIHQQTDPSTRRVMRKFRWLASRWTIIRPTGPMSGPTQRMTLTTQSAVGAISALAYRRLLSGTTWWTSPDMGGKHGGNSERSPAPARAWNLVGPQLISSVL